MDKVEGPRRVLASAMGGMGGLVNEWKGVWNKTFICPLKFPAMPPSFLCPWLSSHLCRTFEIGRIITLQGVRLTFLYGRQGAWGALALQKGKLYQQKMGQGP